MPALLAPVVAWVAGALGASAAAIAAGTGFALAAAQFIVYSAATLALNSAVRAFAPRPKTGASGSMEANYYNAEQRVPLLLGYVRVGGMETIPPITTGVDGEILHRVLAVAGHEVSSYGSVMFDTTSVAQSVIGAVTGTTSDGLVTSGRYANRAWLRGYRGTQADDADFKLRTEGGAPFSTSFRGRGIAKMVCSYKWDQNTYRSGIPQHTMYVSGAKIYDPRLDSTNGGSGSHRYTNESTWVWSENPALIAAWYLMKWGQYDAENEINWPTVSAAANACDALVATPDGNKKRYTCNGVLFAHTNMDEFMLNVRFLIDAMLGRIIYANGVWSIYAGGWQSTTFGIAPEDWLSSPQVIFENGLEKRFNRAHMWFIDPTRNWQRTESYPRSNSTYRIADGEMQLDREFDQPMCTNEYEAQRKCEFLLRASRNQIIVTGRLGPQFQDLSVWDTGTINLPQFGWGGKSFRCAGCVINPDSTVDVTFVEEQQADWTDLASGEYSQPSTAAIPAPNTIRSGAPNNLNMEVIGGIVNANWDPPEQLIVGTDYEIYTAATSLSAVGSKTLLWRGKDTGKALSFSVNTPMYWQIRTDVGGLKSAWTPSTYGLQVAPAYIPVAPPRVWSFDVAPSNISATSSLASITTAQVTATVYNPNATPVYSWVPPSGITVSSAGARQVTFAAASLSSSGEIRSGRAWCMVKDGTDVSSGYCDVTITRVVQAPPPWSLGASPTSVSTTTLSASAVTPQITVTVTNPRGTPVYSWVNIGSANFSITSPSSRSTTVSASGLAWNETRSGDIRCYVSDPPESGYAPAFVTISRLKPAGWALSCNTYSLNSASMAPNQTSAEVTATVANPAGSPSYSWTNPSSIAYVSVNSPSNAATSFSATALPGNYRAEGYVRVDVNDSGITDYKLVYVRFIRIVYGG